MLVACARRSVYQEIVEVRPEGRGEELPDHSCFLWTAPDHRGVAGGEDEAERYTEQSPKAEIFATRPVLRSFPVSSILDKVGRWASFVNCYWNQSSRCLRYLGGLDSKEAWDIRPCKVDIKDPYRVSLQGESQSKLSCDTTLPNT